MPERLLRALRRALVLAALAPAAAAQEPALASPDRFLPIDPAVRTGTLENGLRYYVRANDEPRDRAELRLVVDAGSVLEDDDQRGLAHLLEHMAFNGTRNFEKQELVHYLESVGMRFGPDVNAYTGFDETVYMLTLPTDSAGVLETGIRILEDWAHGVTLDSLEVEKERGVVIEEWRQGRGAGSRMRDEQFPILFRGSRYAERLPIGTLRSLQTASPAAARRFYRDWYRPDLMAVVAVGDFDADRVEALIRERFSALPPAHAARERPSFPVPGHAEPLVAIATDPEAAYSTVGVLYKQPSRADSTVAAYRREIVEQLYDGMLNDRLAELAREPDPPFVNAVSAQGSFLRSGEVYQLQAVVSETGIERGLEALLTEAERVARHGFAPTELERQKADLLRAAERAYAERETTPSARYASEYLGHFLEGEPIPGIAVEYELYRDLVPGVRLEEVNALAREWLTDENRVVLVNAPEKEGVKVPEEAELLAVFGEVEAKEVAAYDDDVSDAPLLEAEPRPGSVTTERSIPELGVTEWELSNGARVLLKPTDFKEDEVLFSAYSPGGYSLVPDRDHIAGETAATVVSASGLGTLDATALQKRLAGQAVRVVPYIGATEEGVRGSASPRDLEMLLQLVHLSFTAPREDSAAFEGLRARQRAVLENLGANPEQTFFDSIRVVLAQHHPRARPVSMSTLDSMDLGRSLEIYRDRFADAGDFTFVFVGNFEPAALRPLVERYVASLPATGREERSRDLGIDYPTGVVEKAVRKGVEPKALTQLIFTGTFEFDAANMRALQSLTDVLRTRLREDLREEQSGTYGVSVNWSADAAFDTTYSVGIGFGSDPARRDELVGHVFAQIDRLKAAPPTDMELAIAKEQQRRALQTQRRENAFWMRELVAHDVRGWDPLHILHLDEEIEAVTPDAVQDAARRYLDTGNYVHGWLVPER